MAKEFFQEREKSTTQNQTQLHHIKRKKEKKVVGFEYANQASKPKRKLPRKFKMTEVLDD